ncbi:FHA domain protein [Ceratobasidium sp. AG-Ba]|nr:FHA domain protein [Ceratobasidium sp. AG-Ba]QRW04114.1 FHA domain protein [Ceratobasidium sp. AG-Ba]
MSTSFRPAHNTAFLRLTVLTSSVLSRRGVVLIDSYDEVSIGRDRCATPRLRLKELAVSKYHASIYWDTRTQLWSLVDMGSTHGTHLVSPESTEAQLSGSVSDYGYNLSKSNRLSAPKTASLPRPLSHLQHIIVGGTTLVVHMHSDQQPCDACTIVGNNLVSLETLKGSGEATTGTIRGEPEPHTANPLKVLRQNLLLSPTYSVSVCNQEDLLRSGTYVDRAERRRQRFPGWRDDYARREVTPSRSTPNRQFRLREPDVPRLRSDGSIQDLETATPIPLSNVGHRLLAKQGWTLGSALGVRSGDEIASNALTEPLVLQGTIDRRGLGMNRI